MFKRGSNTISAESGLSSWVAQGQEVPFEEAGTSSNGLGEDGPPFEELLKGVAPSARHFFVELRRDGWL